MDEERAGLKKEFIKIINDLEGLKRRRDSVINLYKNAIDAVQNGYCDAALSIDKSDSEVTNDTYTFHNLSEKDLRAFARCIVDNYNSDVFKNILRGKELFSKFDSIAIREKEPGESRENNSQDNQVSNMLEDMVKLVDGAFTEFDKNTWNWQTEGEKKEWCNQFAIKHARCV